MNCSHHRLEAGIGRRFPGRRLARAVARTLQSLAPGEENRAARLENEGRRFVLDLQQFAAARGRLAIGLREFVIRGRAVGNRRAVLRNRRTGVRNRGAGVRNGRTGVRNPLVVCRNPGVAGRAGRARTGERLILVRPLRRDFAAVARPPFALSRAGRAAAGDRARQRRRRFSRVRR